MGFEVTVNDWRIGRMQEVHSLCSLQCQMELHVEGQLNLYITSVILLY